MAYSLENFSDDMDIPVSWIKTKPSNSDFTFFSNIDNATQSWLNNLHHVWSLWKKSVGVTQTLHEYFDTAPNPYLSNLRILVNTREFYHIKSRASLPFTVIEEFTNWITPKKDKYKDCLQDDLKIAAYQLVSKQRNNQLLKMVIDVYELPESNHLFVDTIKELIEEKKYKDAGQLVEMLNLQNFFSNPEVLILPLILQNKTTIAEDLMKNQPEIQQKVVTYLDNLLSPETDMNGTLNKYIDDNNIPDVKMSFFSHKPMAKLVARLAKQFKLSPEQCPFLHKKRSEGALQFLVYKRYVDGTLSAESFREMAKEAVLDNPVLQAKILEYLINNNDTVEAVHFAQSFNVPESEWPWHLTSYLQDNSNTISGMKANNSIEEAWDADDNIAYHTLKLNRESIYIISDSRSFQNFLENSLKNINLVGIDSEWKPSFSIKKPELALIQIATDSNVYIIDVTTLGNDVPHLWTEFGSSFFNNKNILKLGFGLANDLKVIRENLPALSHIKATGEGYLDLSFLWKRLQKENFVFPYEGDESYTSEGLGKLAELCLGKRLNKSDQFSNWEKRPLRENQIIYASLDAYCLIEIYNVMAVQCDRLGIPFQDVCHQVRHSPRNSPLDDESQKSSKNKAKKQNNRNNMEFKNNHASKVFDGSLNDQRSQGQNTSIRNQNMPNKSYSKDLCQTFESVHQANRNIAAPHQLHTRLLHNRSKFSSHEENSRSYSNQRHHQNKSTSQPSPSFVCDLMLGGLARQLRKCGLDCVYLARDRCGDQSCRIAFEEKRILLTRNGNFERYQQYLPYGYCYKVMEHKLENQLEEVINHFNIKVAEADIFSRCQICNTNEFVFVSKDTILQMSRRYAKNFQSRPGSSTSNTKELYNYWDTADLANQICDTTTQKQPSCRSWQLEFGSINITNCTTKYKAKVQIDQVPPNVLQHVNKFYVCNGCGKVYWYGSHMERVLKGTLKDILV